MAVETGISTSGTLGSKDFFAQTRLDLTTCATAEESDAALAALLLRYLRHTYDPRVGAWPGHDARDTMRQTCHAAEVLHQLDFDNSTAEMVYHAGNWLINLDMAFNLPPLERLHIRLYPSRFKTLAYLRRFEDEQVRRDFAELLDGENGGMIGNPTGHMEAESADDSALLRTCIALDTLHTLERQGARRALCADDRYQAVADALRERLRRWRPTTSSPGEPAPPTRDTTTRNGHARNGTAPLSTPITTHRDLSYALGLLRHVNRRALSPRQTDLVVDHLLHAITHRDRSRFTEMANLLYPALQLAEHFRQDARVDVALRELLEHLRAAYSEAESPRRWDLASHILVLRLLLAFYTPTILTHGMAARLLTDTERQARVTLETDLQAVIRERLVIALGNVKSLSGGFTDDQVLHVPFHYWFPDSRRDTAQPAIPPAAPEASLIIKRSTSSAFHTATTNYGRLPTDLHHLFIRQPARAEVYKSASSTAYYLPMEDLTNLVTFRDLFDELDQRAMAPQQLALLRQATGRIAEASFTLFRETRTVQAGFPSTQIARLYLSRIESALVRAISRIPWLKTALDGFAVEGQRFRRLESYLGTITHQSHALQPRALGLVHGDFHARNIMFDRQATRIKLIDLDKLSWTGDYLADLGNLLIDITIYRRLIEPERSFGLAPEHITFLASKQAEKGTAENTVRYPALGRPATVEFQTQLLTGIAEFAAEFDDHTWKPRLWLAAATALLFRIPHHTEREIAAVLYGEAVRLLHELVRALEAAQPLPALLVPDTWPAPATTRPPTRAELPAWITQREPLRKLHDGLRAFGLRAEVKGDSLQYFSPRSEEGPVVVLVQARRGGLARLVVRPIGKHQPPATPLETETTTTAEGELTSLAIILPRDGEPQEALRVIRACLGR